MSTMPATGEPSSSKAPNKKVCEVWNSLSIKERMDRVGKNIQRLKNEPYAADTYVYEPKFGKGDPVVACWQGYYYDAVIVNVEKEAYECLDFSKKVPLYRVKYLDWSSGKETGPEETLIVEYALIGTTKHAIAAELLYAHYWNKAPLHNGKKLQEAQLESVFDLPAGTLQKLEQEWQDELQQIRPNEKVRLAQWITLTFAQWIGLE